MTPPQIEPVLRGILWDRLIAIADDILLSIVRTAFSVGVRESWDLACVLFDDKGRSIAQATLSMPAFIGTAPYTIQHMIERFPVKTLSPGDVLATNDPWLGTGHTPDLCVARPIFRGSRLVGFAMTISHLPDVGGAGLSIANREIFEEGLVLPICKLVCAGEPNREIFELLRLNVRTPDQVIGDVMANIGGTELGARLVNEMMDEFGLADLATLADGVIGASEAALRARLREIPAGTYRNEVQVEGVDGAITLSAAVTIGGGAAAIDFTGTGPTVRNAINVPICYTRSFATYAIKCLTTPEIPNNLGTLLPIAVSAPAGCILNAQRPSSTGGRHVVGWFIVPLIMGALAEAMPDRVQAECGMASLFVVHGTRPDGRAVSTQYFVAGGLGAMRGLDGHHTTPSPTNNAVVSSEVWENETGMTVLSRRLLPDSGGAGRWRGGLGQEAVLRNDSGHPLSVAVFGMRTDFPARGLFGGTTGARRSFAIDGKPVASKGRHVLAPGQVLTVREAGGGGYGDPQQRTVDAVRADLAAGFVTPAAARTDYGAEVVR